MSLEALLKLRERRNMIPKQTTIIDNTLASSPHFETKQFQIAVTDKSFKILLDTLYTNKPRAVERELWTNAYDAHVAAGCPERPFDVQLPTPLDPTFRVRDYGVSLNHDKVMNLYSTVFQSTKTDSNAFVGQLGLGSKSPFSYTDTFTVRAWQEGQERLYVASIGSNGIPVITHISTTPSNAERGFEVSFPVQNHHISDFRNEAISVGRGFDVKPNINDVEFDEPVYTGDGWRMYRSAGYRRAEWEVRQGCVTYEVKAQDLGGGLPSYNKFYVVVDVPIGSCDVAASREALSLDDATKQNVITAFLDADVRIRADFKKRIEKATSYLEACTIAADMETMRIKHDSPLWKGQVSIGPIIPNSLWNKKQISDRYGRIAAKKHNNSINLELDVRQLNQYKFCIDRPAYAKTARRKSRMKDFSNGWNHITLWDPSPKQLSRLMRILQLRPDQFVSVPNLHDPGPRYVPKKSKTSTPKEPGETTKSGVYVFSIHADECVTKPSEMPAVGDDFHWLAIDKGVRSGIVLHQDSSVALFSTVQRAREVLSGSVLTTAGIKKVYLLTPQALKRYKPNPDMNTEKVLNDFTKNNDLHDRIANSVAAKQVRSFCSQRYVSSEIGEAIMERYDLSTADIPSFFNSHEAQEEGSVKAKEIIASLDKTYPLLFNRWDEAGQLEYFNWKNSKENK
jgi:hypothetical protein